MPGGDRTGPRGEGPRTGRRAGLCSGYKMPGYANRVDRPAYRGRTASDPPGQARGRGRRGGGRRFWR
ncbi:MAG: DUF5320 domain-containing protein [Archaeoglobaceae archaeon]